MNKFSGMLEEYGISYDELTADEKKLYEDSLVNIRDIGLDDVLETIQSLRVSIELKLCDTPDDTANQDLNCKLKARLKNYVILEGFLLAPFQRRKLLSRQLENVKNKEV